MRKRSRIFSMMLVLIMLVSVLSVTAYADHVVVGSIYDSPNAKFKDPFTPIANDTVTDSGGKVKITADSQIRIGDNFFDLAGSMSSRFGPELKTSMNQKVGNGVTSQTVNGKHKLVIFAYAPHNHKISPNAPWHYDENNHWKDCETCPCWLFMNWHHDVNNDGICDECHQPIVYRKLSVKDTEGGKVTISADKGTVGDRVAVTVKADPGYKLADLRGMNTTAKKYSFRPCIQDIKGSEYHFFVDVYDVEVVAKFVKE